MWLPPTTLMRDQLKAEPPIVEVAVTLPVSIESPGWIVPAAMAEVTSLRMIRARRTAPSTFNSPAPCCSRLAPRRGCAVACRMLLMSGGVSPGLACSSSAAAPATAGAAIDVPLSSICVCFWTAGMPSGDTRLAR